MRTCRAITLIETLIVIGVIGILIGLTAPALRGARAGAGATASLANLAGIGRSLEVYAQSNRWRFPFPPRQIGFPTGAGTGPVFGPLYLTSRPGPNDMPFSFAPIFSMDRNWPMVMHQAAPWEEHFASWLSPGRDASAGELAGAARHFPPRVSYHYSNSFVASPRVWSGEASVTWDDIGPQLVSRVSHPSTKVAMFDAERTYLAGAVSHRTRRPVLFADSSASLRLDSAAQPPSVNGLLRWAGWESVFHNTRRGILGSDY